MAVTRRQLLVVAALLPASVAVGRVAAVAGSLARGGIAAARPGQDGTSATRCAQCGAADHAMLDPRCPRAPRVRT